MASHSQMSSAVKQVIQGIKEEEEEEPWTPMEEQRLDVLEPEIQLTKDSQTEALPEEATQTRGANDELAVVQRMTSSERHVEVKLKLPINLMANFFQ